MTLENIWRRQLSFTAQALPITYGKKIEQLTEDDRVNLTKDYILSLHAELDEVLNTVPWKAHRFTRTASRDDLLEEIVDVQKFLFGLMQLWGVNPSELERAFDRKSDVVEQRFYQDHILPSQVMNDKIAVVDIDDVVANWEQGFIDWVSEVEPTINSDDFTPWNDPGLRTRLKNRIHADGGMLTLPMLFGADIAIKELQSAGYTIIWLTARPVSKHPRLRSDTVEWLKKNSLPYDYIYFSDLNKHVFVAEKFPRAAVLFDDKHEIVARAKEVGIKAYQIDEQSTAKGWTLKDRVEEFLEASNS